MTQLTSFEDVILQLSQKYEVSCEIVESIIVDWADTLYYSMTGRSPNADFDVT